MYSYGFDHVSDCFPEALFRDRFHPPTCILVSLSRCMRTTRSGMIEWAFGHHRSNALQCNACTARLRPSKGLDAALTGIMYQWIQIRPNRLKSIVMNFMAKEAGAFFTIIEPIRLFAQNSITSGFDELIIRWISDIKNVFMNIRRDWEIHNTDTKFSWMFRTLRLRMN